MVIHPRHARAAYASRRAIALVEVIVATIILGVALSILIGLSGRAISSQHEGERLATCAMLLDEQLSLVLARGPDNYAARFDTSGACDAPFEAYRYELAIDGGEAGEAYAVTVTISWQEGGRTRSESLQTMLAPRLGEEPDPDRRPDDPVLRY